MYISQWWKKSSLLIPFELCHELHFWCLSFYKKVFQSQESFCHKYDEIQEGKNISFATVHTPVTYAKLFCVKVTKTHNQNL